MAPNLFHVYDIIARTYGVLPSEIAKLSWKDLFVCIKSIKCRSQRLNTVLRKSKRKKAMIFPTLPINDLIDIL